MKESYGEGVATHTDPESCGGAREGGGEALTGERAGRVLSRERQLSSGVPTLLGEGGRPHPVRRYRETRRDPARSETPRTHGNTSHGNREIPRSAQPAALRDASGSPRTYADDERRGKSDSPVVPAKSPNKAGATGGGGDGGKGGLAKGNPPQQNAPRTQSRDGAPSALERVRQAATRDKKLRFTALLHHVYDLDTLRRPTSA